MQKHATPERPARLPAVFNSGKQQICSSASLAKIKSPSAINALFKVRAVKTPTAALLHSTPEGGPPPQQQGYSSLANSSQLRSLKNFSHFSRQNVLRAPSPSRPLAGSRVSCVVEIQALEKKPEITASHSTAALGLSPEKEETLKGKPRVLKGLPSAFNARDQKHSLSRLRGKRIENWTSAVDAQEDKIEKTLNNNLEASVLWKHASAAAKATRLEPMAPSSSKLSTKLARRHDLMFASTPQNHSVCARLETPNNHSNNHNNNDPRPPLMDVFAEYKEPSSNNQNNNHQSSNQNNNNNNASPPDGAGHFSRSHTSSFSPALDLNNLDFKAFGAKDLPGFPSLMPREDQSSSTTASTLAQSGNLQSFKSLISNKVRRDEMITVGVIKPMRRSGPVKKLLHVPSFKLYAVKQIPFSSREMRFQIKNWAMVWLNSMNACKYTVKLHATFWNHPEGWVSLVLDNMTGCSLQNLLESTGAVPEHLLHEIAITLLKALVYMHGKAKVAHGGISPSQILFERSGKSKVRVELNQLGMGLASKLAQKDEKASYMSGCGTPRMGLLDQNRLSLYESNPAHSPSKLKILHLKKQSSLKEKRGGGAGQDSSKELFANDIFDVGYTLLMAATGGLELLGGSFFDQIKKAKGCCILHHTGYKGKLKLRHLLAQFSKQFLDFLCHCLRFDPLKRSGIHELLKHPWLSKQASGAKLKMQELLAIANSWKKDAQLPIECQGPSQKQLEALCNAMAMALPTCAESTGTSDDLAAGYILDDPLIREHRRGTVEEIASDLGLDKGKVARRVEDTLRQLRDKKYS